MEKIPIKIITKEEMEKILKEGDLGKAGTMFGYGVIGNKKTGKIVEKFKINRMTGEKTILFRDLEDEMFKKKKGGAE
ncbi:MAG: hypothetical protein ABIJ14_00685 [Nanoarchaeota archaeon]